MDVFDQMTKISSIDASSRRWPMHEVYNMINLALINSLILYKHVCKEDINARKFIQRLFEKLTDKHVLQCSKDKDMLDEPSCKVHCVTERSGSTSKLPRLICYFVKCKNNTTNNCYSCQQHISGTYTKTYCPFCFSK